MAEGSDGAAAGSTGGADGAGGASSSGAAGNGPTVGAGGAGTGGTDGVGGAGGSGGSVGMGGATGAGGSGGMPEPPFCDPTDASLLACFRFEGDAKDESGKTNTVTPTNVTFKAGVDGQAADLKAGSQVFIDDAPHWDVTEYTVELWYYQRSHPGTRMGLFDSDGRYGFFIYGQGDLQCTRGGAIANMQNMPLDTWTHAACVFGGGKLRLYVNGTQVEEVDAMAPVAGSGSNAVGSNAPDNDSLDGRLDNVRIWNVARSAADICKAAGQQGC
ncbi:LamG domain-containing protein [Polyangium sp. 6x1]|uniref:LamG domain-containing protein n=1 Tax=Polyangium sp. 6x1 TaxID=3042689 RepID=UPI002482C7B2|nr:LamG domain-containing protein [Polyangium sp. 6x1]MDI1450734.1 LamG domain-containing protein [Polyangium sp. 6x1]